MNPVTALDLFSLFFCPRPKAFANWSPNPWVYIIRGTQREYSSKPLKHSIVKRFWVFKR